MIDRSFMKKEAKSVLRGAKANPYGFALVFSLITVVLTGLRTYVTGANEETTRLIEEMQLSLPAFLDHPPFPPLLVLFVTVMVYLLTTVLNAGWVLYHLGIREKREMPFTTLFEGLAFAGKLILLDVVMGIFIALWSFLFVIPGIIAAYRYRFAVYNLCEDPSIGVMEAINMSKVQTSGYKWSLFVLDLSFLGWAILSAFTAGILEIWLLPYMQQTNVGYFLALKSSSGVGYRAGGNDAPGEGEMLF